MTDPWSAGVELWFGWLYLWHGARAGQAEQGRGCFASRRLGASGVRPVVVAGEGAGAYGGSGGGAVGAPVEGAKGAPR